MCHEGSVAPGGRDSAGRCRLAREGNVQGVGCVKAVSYKGNKKVWNNQINAEIFCLNGKYYNITCNVCSIPPCRGWGRM